MAADIIANNLFVVISGLLVFTMTASVGLLEVGELGKEFAHTSLLKAMLISGIGFFVMAIVGFNTAFAPTIAGAIGNPLYAPGFFLGGFSANATGLLTGVYWSMTSSYFGVGLTTGAYFLFETGFATVTLALVGVIILKRVKLEAFVFFSVFYFAVIWALPAAWIWNPTGWLYALGMRDFAGGLVVHGAAGAAGLGILLEVILEERKAGRKPPEVPINVSPSWLTLSVLLLWVGWFGFNPGSVLAFNSSALTVVLTTFLAASSSFLSLMAVVYWKTRRNPGLINMANGVLMGLIVITPLAGFVSPGSAIILGIICGPLFYGSNSFFAKRKSLTDPVGLFPGHLFGGIFGVLMIAFFSQSAFAAASGTSSLPNGLLFGGGTSAATQLGIEAFGIAIVIGTVIVLSFFTMKVASLLFRGIVTSEKS